MARKQKYRTADQARVARENAVAWEALKAKYPVTSKVGFMAYTPPRHPRADDRRPEASRDSAQSIAEAQPPKVYTGTMMKGVAALHKSSLVPVFSKEEAVDIAKMRRG